MKKGLVILFSLFSFILIAGLFSVYAQADVPLTQQAPSASPDGEAGVFEAPVDESMAAEDIPAQETGISGEPESVPGLGIEGDEELEKLVGEAQKFDEKLETDGGLTPGSPLYFVDNAFDNLQNPARVREEKIAEMKELSKECNAGVQKACGFMRDSFERYQIHAERFKNEISPDERAYAEESSRAIRGEFVREIARNVPPQYKDEFVKEIMTQENEINTAAEVAAKIKELCVQLSELDPSEYSRVCRAEGGEEPRWKRELDRQLTEEQRNEAEKFGEIMSECFATSGQQCDCEEIPFPEFAETCLIAAPLATACEVEGNEEACQKLDEIEMPELPDYLQDIMDNLEGKMAEDRFEMYEPPECREAGARDAKKCTEIMFRKNAPGPCLNALDRGEISFTNEREARESCEKIMFSEFAPQECIDAGLTSPKECGKLMFSTNAPQECVDAGITGENPNDPRKCEQLMSSFRGGFEGFPGEGGAMKCLPGERPGMNDEGEFSCIRGQPANFGGNCKEIQDSKERLNCYDGAVQGIHEYRNDFDDRFRETQDMQRKCAEDCRAKNSAWDFSNGNCVCRAPDMKEFEQRHEGRFQPENNGDFRGGQYFAPPMQQYSQQPPQQFQPPTEQQPYYQQPPPGEFYQQPPRIEGQPYYPQPGEFQPYQQYPQPTDQYQQPPQEFQQPSTQESSGGTSTTTTSTEGSTKSSGSSGGESSSAPVTSGVIAGNGFLKYFWWWRR